MGKIRVKTIGEEEKTVSRSEIPLRGAITEARKKQKAQKKKVHLAGMKGGQRVAVVGPTEEELAAAEITEKSTEPLKKIEALKKKGKIKPKRVRSKKYLAWAALVDRNKTYSVIEALALLEKMSREAGSRSAGPASSFDETVELHINTVLPISIQTNLPHGTGKKARVALASDQLIGEIEKGKLDFDVLLATPAMMPKLAKVAKILGPKGLMPNPKAGTISENPQALLKKYEGGQISFKTEAKFPILHLSVGKMSFGKTKLEENINASILAIKKENIKKVVLKSTMSPGIKISF